LFGRDTARSTDDTLSPPRLHGKSHDPATVFNVAPRTAASFLSFTQSAKKFGVYKRFPALSIKVASDTHQLETEGHVNMLVVKVISARGLAKADVVGSSDPMCEVYWQGEKLSQTKTIRNNLNPTWNHEFLIPIELDTILESELRLEVHDMDVGSKGDFLGCIVLNSDDILDSVGGRVSFALRIGLNIFEYLTCMCGRCSRDLCSSGGAKLQRPLGMCRAR
jgi:hypothetical protein